MFCLSMTTLAFWLAGFTSSVPIAGPDEVAVVPGACEQDDENQQQKSDVAIAMEGTLASFLPISWVIRR